MPIQIRKVEPHEVPETVNIYLESMRSDYSFKPRHYLDAKNVADELEECEEWLNNPELDSLILVAMDGDYMAGYIALSRNTAEPFAYEGEVSGFFIRQQYRSQGIGLRLLRKGMEYFQSLGITGLVIYNYRISVANPYYRMLGGEVVKQEIQKPGGMPLDTDVFGYQVGALIEILDQKLQKYAL
jgi:ribosomal protein S18 acetylase RimI-like enzyme